MGYNLLNTYCELILMGGTLDDHVSFKKKLRDFKKEFNLIFTINLKEGFKNEQQINDVTIWCEENLDGNFLLSYYNQNLSSDEDLLKFILRWE